MKKIFLFICLLGTIHFLKAQDKFFIKGNIKGILERASIGLYYLNGMSMSSINFSTIEDGIFLLSDTINAGPKSVYLLGDTRDGFPFSVLRIWVAPGKTIKITGKGYAINSWKIKSSVKEQKEDNKYRKATYKYAKEVEKLLLTVEEQKKTKAVVSEEEVENYKIKYDSLTHLATITILKMLYKRPVSAAWMSRFHHLTTVYIKNNEFEKELRELYTFIPEEQKESVLYHEITKYLFSSAGKDELKRIREFYNIQ